MLNKIPSPKFTITPETAIIFGAIERQISKCPDILEIYIPKEDYESIVRYSVPDDIKDKCDNGISYGAYTIFKHILKYY